MSSDGKELSEASYWNARYSGTDPERLGGHEWFRSYADLKQWLDKHLPDPKSQPSILHLGCGTMKTLTADLFKLGYEKQVSVDFSPVVIEAMESKYKETGLEWRVMDVRAMEFAAETFDVAFDKGTLDAMLYGSLWDPPDEVKANVKAYIDEVARCLKPNGQWLYVTYRQPHFLRPLLRRDGIWTVEVERLGGEGGTFEYFGFVMSKRVSSSQEAEEASLLLD